MAVLLVELQNEIRSWSGLFCMKLDPRTLANSLSKVEVRIAILASPSATSRINSRGIWRVAPCSVVLAGGREYRAPVKALVCRQSTSLHPILGEHVRKWVWVHLSEARSRTKREVRSRMST